MYLLIDGQPLQAATRTRGIGRYSGNLVAALRAARPDWRIEVVASAHLPPLPPLAGCRLRRFEPPFLFKSENADFIERYYADWLTGLDPDAILMLDFFRADAFVPRFHGARPPLFGILYDLIPLVFPDRYLGRSLDHYLDYAIGLRRMVEADALFAISEASARDFRRLLAPPRPQVVAIGGAADPRFGPLPLMEQERQRSRLRGRFGLERDFVLYVGGPDFRKNLHGAVEAFALVPPSARAGLDLVVACELSSEQGDALMQQGRDLGIADSLRLTGFVSDDELCVLYQLCRVFFFPSLYEGLGLPVLEALQCGAPVVAADNSSVPEFAGNVTWLAEARSPHRLADALARALAEPAALRRSERMAHARSFTWQRCAETLCHVLTTPPAPAVPRRPRLAWVAPQPPLPCSAAGASALLGPLTERYEIDLVTAPNQPALPPALVDAHALLRPFEVAARHSAAPYDLFVYHLGNTPHCRFALELLHRYPGLLVLHDDDLTEMTHDAAALHGTLHHLILSAAEGVIVQSVAAWQRARQLLSVPVVYVPPVSPAENTTARYAGLIDLLLARRSAGDATWVNQAVQAIQSCADPQTARAFIDGWSALRVSGQQLRRARTRTPVECLEVIAARPSSGLRCA